MNSDVTRQTFGVLVLVGLWLVIFLDDAVRTWQSARARRRRGAR